MRRPRTLSGRVVHQAQYIIMIPRAIRPYRAVFRAGDLDPHCDSRSGRPVCHHAGSTQGRRAGFASMFGIEAGEVIWIAAAATGVAALLAASTPALTALRFAGAVYLIFLGIQRWRKAAVVTLPERASFARIFAQGFVTQLLNPKVAIFAIAFIPQFLNVDRPIAPQVALLGAVYISVAVVVDVLYVLAAARVSGWLLRSPVAQRRSGRAAAATYFALGIAAAFSGVKSETA